MDKLSLDAFRMEGVNGPYMRLSGVYAVGLGDDLVTIHSQQVRAICLARLLTQNAAHKRDLCIIGGGIAGLTLSLELLRHDWTDITIVERLPDLLGVQNGCDTRWVHPHIIDWPDKGSEEKVSTIGTLDWTASTASNVTLAIETAWTTEVGYLTKKHTKGRPPRKLSVHVGVTHLRARQLKEGVEIEWIRDSRVRPMGFHGSDVLACDTKTFSHVVLATGYGTESQSTHSYWRNEAYGQLHIDGVQKGYVVSGLGDGAISDLLRLSIRNFRHDRAIDNIVQLKELRDELRQIKCEVFASQSDLLSALTVSASKNKPIGLWWKELFKLIQDLRREDTKVILYHNSNDGFSNAFNRSPASFLNKLLLFVLYKCGVFQYVDKSQCCDANAAALIYGIPCENVIKRHGADRRSTIVRIFGGSPDDFTIKQQSYEECKNFLNSQVAKPTTDQPEKPNDANGEAVSQFLQPPDIPKMK